jgi:hypothetical protein
LDIVSPDFDIPANRQMVTLAPVDGIVVDVLALLVQHLNDLGCAPMAGGNEVIEGNVSHCTFGEYESFR